MFCHIGFRLPRAYQWQQSVQAPYCLGTSGFQKDSEGNAAVNGARKWVRDAAQAPIRQAKKLATFSPDEGIRRALFCWEGFHATHELSVDEASLFFDADGCGFVSWRHAAFHIEPRVKTRFLGECTPTGAENKPPAWILDLRRSKKHLRLALH